MDSCNAVASLEGMSVVMVVDLMDDCMRNGVDVGLSLS